MGVVNIEEQLIKAGIKPTAQRIAIFRFLQEEANHPTADDVKIWMDKNFPMVSLATVYNTLNLFVKAGLLLELRFPHDDRVVFDMNTQPHHHFLDEQNGELIDLDLQQVRVESNLGDEFQIRETQTILIGQRKQS